MKITMEQFLLRQPSGPEEKSTDRFYLNVANALLGIAEKEHLFKGWPESVVRQCALCLVGYYQDVIADAGIWHGFVNECRRLYGRPVPFYDTADDYIDYELNPEDVRFMVWYVMAMTWEEKRVLDPLDKVLLRGADRWFDYLEEKYEEAPVPEDYHLAHELDIYAPEDQEGVMTLGNWLYLHCYLLTPANALTLSEIVADLQLNGAEGQEEVRQRLHRAMSEFPTGPLALYLREWLFLVLADRMPPRPRVNKDEEEPEDHPYYTAFVAATGGRDIAYFGDYASLNRFFIEGLGWAQGEEHLSQLKGSQDFVLMVNQKKGMLLARNVAKCIADPGNPFYNRDYARKHAIDLLTVRGLCPADLRERVCSEGWLPDASFPGSQDTQLVRDNSDFIARCYLQQYYRGD